MKKLEYWTIPRSDTKERCGKCLFKFRKSHLQFNCKELAGYRFEKVCGKCLIKNNNKV